MHSEGLDLALPARTLPRTRFWEEVGGWVGALMILLAFYLLAEEVIEKRRLYYLMNVVGALLVTLVAYRKRAWQPVFLDGVWALIGIWALATLE